MQTASIGCTEELIARGSSEVFDDAWPCSTGVLFFSAQVRRGLLAMSIFAAEGGFSNENPRLFS